MESGLVIIRQSLGIWEFWANYSELSHHEGPLLRLFLICPDCGHILWSQRIPICFFSPTVGVKGNRFHDRNYVLIFPGDVSANGGSGV